MSLWRRVYRYKMFRSLVISYSALVLITILLLAVTLTCFFTRTTTHVIENNLKSMLTQESYASDVINDQVTSISEQLIMDKDVTDYISTPPNGSDDQKVITYHMLLKLSSFQADYHFIKSIGIFNYQTDSYIDTMSMPLDTQKLLGHSSEFMFYYPRVAPKVEPTGTVNSDLLTFVFNSNSELQNISRFAVVINIDPDFILNTISGINGNSQNSNIFVINSDGQVVSHPDPAFFLKNMSQTGYVKKILKSKNKSGNLISFEKGQKEDVTFVRSYDLGLYFISAQPYDHIIADITQLRLNVLFVSVLLFVLGMLISLGVSGYMYSPIRHLVEKITKARELNAEESMDEYAVLSDSFDNLQKIQQSAESFLSSSAKQVRQNYLFSLIKGIQNPDGADTAGINTPEGELKGPFFRVLILRLDRFEALRSENREDDLNMFRAAVCTLAENVFSGVNHGNAVVTEEDEVAVLLQSEAETVSEDLSPDIQKLQQLITQSFKVTVSAAVGNSVEGRNSISMSYKQAAEYMRYRFFYGENCIVDAVTVERHMKKNVRYPYAQEKKLIEAIQACNITAAHDAILHFVAEIGESPYYQLMAYCTQIVVAIYKLYEKTGIFTDEQVDTIFRLNKCGNIEEISLTLTDFVNRVCAQIQVLNAKMVDQKHREIVERAQNYILENYGDPRVSLDQVAEIIGISSGYLGKLFKLVANETFNDYLNAMRMKQARELLAHTTEPVSRVCEKVGICSVTYFSTLFRKTFSMTPTQFRELEQLHATTHDT